MILGVLWMLGVGAVSCAILYGLERRKSSEPVRLRVTTEEAAEALGEYASELSPFEANILQELEERALDEQVEAWRRG